VTTSIRPLRVLAAVALATLVTACSGGGAEPEQKLAPTPPGTPDVPGAQDIAVDVRPREASLAANDSVVFAAAVTGTANPLVTWSVLEAGGGTVDADGRYTAPGTAGTYRVRASSVVDATRSATATVTVTAPPQTQPVGLSVAPTSPTVDECRTVAFTATVTNTTNRAVTWSVQEPDGGAVTTAGVYTAPARSGTFHVVATSQADATKRVVIPVTVRTNVLSVTISPPGPVAVAVNGNAQFTATVTTTCGSTTTTQTVAAPN
jgi:hypothetical protein